MIMLPCYPLDHAVFDQYPSLPYPGWLQLWRLWHPLSLYPGRRPRGSCRYQRTSLCSWSGQFLWRIYRWETHPKTVAKRQIPCWLTHNITCHVVNVIITHFFFLYIERTKSTTWIENSFCYGNRVFCENGCAISSSIVGLSLGCLRRHFCNKKSNCDDRVTWQHAF